MLIRKATPEDANAVWEIIRQVIATGDTYVFAPDSSKDKMLDYWFAPSKHTYVAELDAQIVGTFIITDNHIDLGAHVANASYMTLPGASGKGIGTTMGKFSLQEAKKLGYHAMQFNLVIKSNERAIKLWQKLGFKIIGEIPEAFQHQTNGLTNAYIMWQAL